MLAECSSLPLHPQVGKQVLKGQASAHLYSQMMGKESGGMSFNPSNIVT